MDADLPGLRAVARQVRPDGSMDLPLRVEERVTQDEMLVTLALLCLILGALLACRGGE